MKPTARPQQNLFYQLSCNNKSETHVIFVALQEFQKTGKKRLSVVIALKDVSNGDQGNVF